MNRQRFEFEVVVGGSRVGVLRGGTSSRVRFIADSNWLEGGQYPRLGWCFLVDSQRRSSESRMLPAWFENLLPEVGSPLRKRVCAHFDIGEYDSPGLLGALGADLPGAVEVRGWADPYGEESSEVSSVGQIESFAERLRFSVAGMQPKLSMALQNDRWILPAKKELGSWYVKFASGELADLPRVEYFTMQWARAVGLDVPEHQLIRRDALHGVEQSFLGSASFAFAVKRFDRDGNARIHQEDLAQALEIRPYDKYGGPGRLSVSYDSLARLVGDACGESGKNDYIKRVAFMVACGNNDAHLKNWSIQWLSGMARSRLSPCYDLVATVSWPQFGWGMDHEVELALPFAGRRSMADLDQSRVDMFLTRARASTGADLFRETLVQARDSWASMVADAPLAMAQGLVSHWERVPILRSLGGLAMT